MAKKDLRKLMSGIIGDTDTSSPTAPEKQDEAEVSKRPLPQKLDSVDECRATFILPTGDLKKIRMMAVLEGCKQKDLIAEAVSDYIKKWEAANGQIPVSK